MTTLLIPAAYFCNSLTVSYNGTTSTTVLGAGSFVCSGGSISSYSVTGALFVVQSIGIINTTGSSPTYAITNIASYQ
jgi:hypothetical protein